MRVLAVDPGTSASGWALLDDAGKPLMWGVTDNQAMLDDVVWKAGASLLNDPRNEEGIGADAMVIEQVSSYGMPVGRDVFETVYWTGRFVQAWLCADMDEDTVTRIPRGDVKLHLCGSTRAKDKNVTVALKDRYGGEEKAVGGVKCQRCKGKGWFGAGRPACTECSGEKWLLPPGPLYGLTGNGGHALAALAVGVTWLDRQQQESAAQAAAVARLARSGSDGDTWRTTRTVQAIEATPDDQQP